MPRFRDWADVFRDSSFSIDHSIPVIFWPCADHFFLYSPPIRFVRFDGKSVNRRFSVLSQTLRKLGPARGCNSCCQPKRALPLRTRMLYVKWIPLAISRACVKEKGYLFYRKQYIQIGQVLTSENRTSHKTLVQQFTLRCPLTFLAWHF